MSIWFTKILSFFTVIAFIALVFLQLHNTTYPLPQGFDATAHVEYVRYLRDHRSLPLPHTGWELSQAPLYYFLAAVVSSFTDIRFLGVVMWSIFVMTVWLFLSRLQKEEKNNQALLLRGAVFLVTAATPVMLYLTPAIGNEFTAGVMITLCLVYYTQWYKPQPTLMSRQIILGVLLGLTLLSKATSIVLLGSIVIEQLISQRGRVQKIIREIGLPMLYASAIGGWFYVRNFVLYGNPMYQAADFVPLSSFGANIVQRDFSFFTTLKGFFTFDLFASHYYSFLSGTFFTWFYDGHGILLPVQMFTKVGNILVLMGLLLFVVAVYGAARLGWRALKSKKKENSHYLLLTIYTVALMVGYIHYNFRLPFYSTVKGSFICSLALPFSYFLYKGWQELSLLLPKKVRPLFTALFVIGISLLYVGLVYRHFWIDPDWYRPEYASYKL